MTSRRLLDPVTKTLLNAADLIEQRGWWDGSRSLHGHGERLCAMLSLGSAAFALNQQEASIQVYKTATKRLINYLGLNSSKSIPKWNDTSNAPTVVAALRAAALGGER